MGCAPLSRAAWRCADQWAPRGPAALIVALPGNSAPVWASTVRAYTLNGRTSSRGARGESPGSSVITLLQTLRCFCFASAPVDSRQGIVSYGDTEG
jgi:hypothetical protein